MSTPSTWSPAVLAERRRADAVPPAGSGVGSAAERELTLEVREVTSIATDVIALTLVDLSGGELPSWAPGAHIDLIVEPFTRQYSLSGDPADRKQWRIAILKEPSGRGASELIHNIARAGLVVR